MSCDWSDLAGVKGKPIVEVSIVSAAAPNLPKGEPAIHEELLNLSAQWQLQKPAEQMKHDLLFE